MGHLPVLAVILLQPAIVWAQATAPAANVPANNNPLLSLNVPNLGNLLGGLLGGLGLGGAMANYGGGGFFNQGGLGFGNMLGLFNHNNNLFLNQLLFNGFLGMAFFKFTALTMVMGIFMLGGILIKFLVFAAVLSLFKWSPGHSHYYRRSNGFQSTSHPSQSWEYLHPSDSSFLWEEKRSRHFH